MSETAKSPDRSKEYYDGMALLLRRGGRLGIVKRFERSAPVDPPAPAEGETADSLTAADLPPVVVEGPDKQV